MTRPRTLSAERGPTAICPLLYVSGVTLALAVGACWADAGDDETIRAPARAAGGPEATTTLAGPAPVTPGSAAPGAPAGPSRPYGEDCATTAHCATGLTCIDGVCCGRGSSKDTVGTWGRRAPLSGVRYSMGVVANRGYIYAIGGTWYVEGSGSGSLDTVQRYDPRTDTWVARAKLPEAASLTTVAALAGQIHVFVYDKHWVYDPPADRWTKRSTIPKSIGLGAAAAVLGGDIHVVNGTTHLSWIAASDSWAAKTAPPASLSASMAATVDGKMIVVSGSLPYVYDLQTDSWSTKHPLKARRVDVSGGFQSVVDGRVIVAAGGASVTEAYNPKTDASEALAPAPSPVRDRTGTAALCGRVYLLGGTVPGVAYAYNDVLDLK